MSRILLTAVGVAAALAVPVGSAHADTCVVTPTTGTTASVCVASEGLAPVPGGYTTASRVSVSVNGTTVTLCIARTTVSTSGVYHDPRTVYAC
ncbi:MAG TPA: hypothetical protein VFQ85_18195 [Mycobacteriales bacterium]|jgi:hypothetical protein|nr:hypothetical protein [Mycobacteriales bacterium]